MGVTQKTCSRCGNSKPLHEFYKCKGGAHGVRGDCKPCNRSLYDGKRLVSSAAWRAANPEKARQAVATWMEQNREKYAATKKAWYAKNCEKERARGRVYAKAYSGANKDAVLARGKEWVNRNRAAKNARNAMRHAAKLRAVPSWADKSAIAAIYELASQQTLATGIKWHVDHAVPLQGKTVCGLHVENNLRVILATENLQKHNSTWPDMP